MDDLRIEGLKTRMTLILQFPGQIFKEVDMDGMAEINEEFQLTSSR